MTEAAKTSKSQAKAWSKPELERLGKITDVAGSLTTNNNGPNINVRS